MASQGDLEDAVQECMDHVHEVADNTSKWSQAESAEILETVASECREYANVIRSEIAGDDG